jgi:hypothetical protein
MVFQNGGQLTSTPGQILSVIQIRRFLSGEDRRAAIAQSVAACAFLVWLMTVLA